MELPFCKAAVNISRSVMDIPRQTGGGFASHHSAKSRREVCKKNEPILPRRKLCRTRFGVRRFIAAFAPARPKAAINRRTPKPRYRGFLQSRRILMLVQPGFH